MKSILPRLRDQAGMSMLSVMMASSIGLGVVYAMSEAIFQMSRGQKAVSISGEWNEFYGSFDKLLRSDESCGVLLSGEIFPIFPAAAGEGTEIKIDGLKPYGLAMESDGEIGKDIVVDRDFKIDSLKMRNISTGGLPQTVKGMDPLDPTGKTFKDYQRFLVEIAMKGRKIIDKMPDGVGIKERKSIIAVLVDPGSKRITSCHSEGSIAEACIATGGAWDPSKPPNERCVPAQFCQHGGSYAEPPGQDRANPLTGTYGCPVVTDGNPYIRIKTGESADAVSCGKNCVGNANYVQYYTCLKCK